MRREVMQFIMDNYIWFAVGGIVIIMAIIGYFADKTDFGRNNEEKAPKVKKEKKPKKEKETNESNKIEVDAKGIGDLTQSMADMPVEQSTDTVYTPLESTETTEEVDASLFEPLVPLSNEEVATEEPTTLEETVEPITTSIDIPATDAMATVEETEENELQPFVPNTIEEPIENDVEETTEPEAQTIEPLQEEPVQIPASEPEATDEEDIWKF